MTMPCTMYNSIITRYTMNARIDIFIRGIILIR